MVEKGRRRNQKVVKVQLQIPIKENTLQWCAPVIHNPRQGQEDQKFKVILSYTPSSRLAWATKTVSGRKGGRKGRKKSKAGAWLGSLGLRECGAPRDRDASQPAQ